MTASVSSTPSRTDGVGVIGMACHFPGAASVDAFWANLVAGKVSLSDVPASRWDAVGMTYSDRDVAGKVGSAAGEGEGCLLQFGVNV